MKVNVKTKNKPLVLFVLGIFIAGMLFFIGLTTYEYFHYRDGISVQGTVLDIHRFGARKQRRTYTANISLIVNGETITTKERISARTLSIGGVGVSTSKIKTGDQLEMRVVSNKKGGYDIAVADEVLHPGKDFFWLFLSLALAIFCFVIFWKKEDKKYVSSHQS